MSYSSKRRFGVSAGLALLLCHFCGRAVTYTRTVDRMDSLDSLGQMALIPLFPCVSRSQVITCRVREARFKGSPALHAAGGADQR